MKMAKNSRKAAVKGDVSLDPAQSLIINLNHGQHCRMLDASNLKNPHLKVGSDAFWALVDSNAEAGVADRLAGEIRVLAEQYPTSPWVSVYQELDARS